MKKHLVTLYTRTPLHVGCGTSVDVVDLPIMRERITNFPVIPSTSLKGVLREAARQHFGDEKAATTRLLFGEDRKLDSDNGEGGKVTANAGCVQIMEAKLLAFPVRSLAGCFAWLTCPAALRRFQRDTDKSFTIPEPRKNQAIAGAELITNGHVILEEYALEATQLPSDRSDRSDLLSALGDLTADPLWSDKLPARLAILHDEDFQHFVSTCTEVVARIVINPETRTNTNLFNQENVPCEALFYSVLHVFAPRRNDSAAAPGDSLAALLKANPTLQIGGDETTGHGFCSVHHETLNA